MIDHCFIYVLIAGTYTPFALITLHGPYGWSLLGTIWGLALLGIGFKIFTTGRFEMLSLAIYLAMGWCGIVVLRPLLHSLAVPGLWLLLVGGLSYTVGVAFYSWERLRYHHMLAVEGCGRRTIQLIAQFQRLGNASAKAGVILAGEQAITGQTIGRKHRHENILRQ